MFLLFPLILILLELILRVDHQYLLLPKLLFQELSFWYEIEVLLP